MITVNSWEDLLKLGEKCILENIETPDIEFSEEFVLKVKVEGPTWDEYIDYRGANYVLDLQKSVNRIYKELSESEVPGKELNKLVTVKIKVAEGSSLFEIKPGEALQNMMERLSGKQITLIATLAILCATGYFTTGRILDYKRQVKTQEQISESARDRARQISPVIDRALNVIEHADPEKPMRSLTNKMGSEDTLILRDQETYSADQAKKLYPRKPKLPNEHGYFDGTYQVINIDVSKAPPVFLLYKDGETIRATADMDSKSVDDLANKLREVWKSKEELHVPFHVFIVYNRRGIKSASITKIDEKRDGSENFEDLLSYIK